MRPDYALQSVGPIRSAWLCLSAVVLLGACSTARDLTATDSSALAYNARAVARLSGSGSGSGGGSGIEVDYATVRGSDRETIGPAETVVLGDQSVAGPVDLRNDVRVQTVHVAFNYLLFASRPVEMEWFAGLGGVRVDWAAQPMASTQPRLTTQEEWLGAIAGIGGRWKFASWAALEGRLSINYSLAGVLGSETIGWKTMGEVGFAFKPAPQVALRAGYAQSTTYVDKNGFESRLTFRARGPYLGLGLMF